QESGKSTIAPAYLSIWSGVTSCEEQTRLEWFPARSLLSQKLCYVPAAAVYPSSRLNQMGLFEKTSAGAATHTNFANLLTAGLTSALAYEGIRHLAQGRATLARLEQTALEELDDELTFLLHNAQHFQRPFELLEVLHPSPVHLVLAHTVDPEQQPVTVFGWGLSAREAVSQALLDLVGNLQF